VTPGELVAYLRAQGVSVGATHGTLRLGGPEDERSAPLRTELRWRGAEVAALLTPRQLGSGEESLLPPEKRATLQHLAGGVRDDCAGRVLGRFAKYGTRPAADDLAGAALLERHLTAWCDLLNDTYRGRVTLVFNEGGDLLAFARGCRT
jgi:hypothetical protein